MINTHETQITRSEEGNKLLITRDFSAALPKVWRAWTESDLLEKWWAPRPWKAVTATMDFSDGGKWFYAMTSPQGEKHWCRVDFHEIAPETSFKSSASFTDEAGTTNPAFPVMHWTVQFSGAGDTTHVNIEINFDSEADLQTIVQMGFKEGFTMAQGNLDELLAEL